MLRRISNATIAEVPSNGEAPDEERHAPASIENGTSLGMGVVDRLEGSDQAVDRILSSLRQAQRESPWLTRWDDLDVQHLRRQLDVVYSTVFDLPPDVVVPQRSNGRRRPGAAWVTPNEDYGPGLRFSTVREVSGGAEDIDIRVSVRRVSGARPGRVERGGIDMIPNFFSDLGTSDTMSWSRGF